MNHNQQITHNEVIRLCQQIIEEAGQTDRAINASNFLDYANFVRDIVKEWPRAKVAERLDRATAAPKPLAANWLPWAAVGAALVRGA